MTTDAAHWYFAYGSNMQAATLRGRRGLQPLDVRVGLLRGYRVCFDIPIGAGTRGVANLEALGRHDSAAGSLHGGSGTWGVLYLLAPQQHEHLDRTEGVPSGLYRRLRVDVEASGSVVAADTYISDLRDPSRRPSHRYRSIILDGAREHGLPADYVALLEAWELAWDERDGAVNPPGVTPPAEKSAE